MATLIGVVSQVIGEVFAVAGNGARRALTEGDRVFAGEQLVTGASGAVAIALVGGGELTLGRDSNLMLDTQLLAGARGDGSAAAAQGAVSAPSAQDLAEVEQLQAAIEAGEDPTASLEATAAGPGAGAAGNAGGGHSFVLLDETAGALDPVIGFPTAGLSFVPVFPDPDIVAAGADIALSAPQIILGGRQAVFESALATGSNAAGNGKFATGTFTLSDADGLGDLQSVTINGVTVTIANLAGSVFAGTSGTLTITAYSSATGVVSYSYELTNQTTDGPGIETDTFSLSVSDGTASSAPTSIIFEIIDDVPNAVDDSNSIAEDSVAPITGSVLDNDLHANGQPGADTPNSFVSWSSTAASYGTFTDTGNGTYSFLLDNSNPLVQGLGEGETLIETFTYTMRDADGDLATATLTITILGADDGVTITGLNQQGGEVLVDEDDLPGGTDQSDPLSDSGTFGISAPDGIASISIGGVSFSYAQLANAGSVNLVIDSPAGVLVINGYSGTAAGGTVSYTYTLQDPVSNVFGSDQASESFAVVVTDVDGSSANDSLDVTIIDDQPIAANDSNSLDEDTASVGGNVLTNDIAGADGGKVVTTPGSYDGNYGQLQLNVDGSYTYTLYTDPATQAIIQGLSDDQSLSDSFGYGMRDSDNDPDSATLTLTIQGADDGVTITGLDTDGGEALVDEDDLPNGSDQSDPLSDSGSFGISAPDGIASISIGGMSFTYAQLANAGSVNLVIDSPAGVLVIDGYSGTAAGGTVSYSYTLQDPVSNAIGASQASESFAVVVTDEDGSFSSDTLDVTIIDDVPTAYADSNSVAEGGVVNGNVLTDGLADVFGADGATAGGGVVGVKVGGDTATPAVGSIGALLIGSYGTLVLNANGSYTYDGFPNVVPPAGASDLFTYTIRDADGDLSTTTLTIDLSDSGLMAPNDNDVVVYENALDLNQDGADLAAGTVTGSLPGSTAETDASNQLNGSGGVGNLTYSLVGSATGSYGTIQINADGSYVYTLTSPYTSNPASDDGANTEPGRDSFTYLVTDANGNTQTGTINVDIVDDVPRAFAPVEALLVDQVPTSHTVTASLNFAGAAGADGVGTVIFSNFTEGDIATDADGQPLFFNGEQLYLYYGIDQTQLVAKTADNDIGYTIDIDPVSDTYTVTTHGVISNGAVEVTTTNLNGVGAGNVNFKGLVDIGGTMQDALISSTTGSINSDIDDIGIANQWISTAENVRFDFVNGLATGGANGTGFVYTDHNLVFGFRQKVYVQGGKTNTANLIVMAIIANNDYVFGSSDLGETQVNLSISDIKVFNGSGADVTGSVNLVDNGTSITIEGMQDGWTFQIVSDTAFSAVYVEGAADTDEFSLGFFTYTQTVPGQPIDLSHAITATDGDGDAVSSAINATLYPATTSMEGDSGDNSITGTAGVDHLFGYEGNDTLNGLLGDDVLSGGDGHDILIGGLGDDLMSGGAGSDIFRWLAGESGTDTITDFVKGFNSGGDQLDLSELLVGEHGAPGDLGNLLNYIDIAISGLDTVLTVSSTAVADPAAAAEQTIVLQNVDLYASYGVGNEADLMLSMLGDGTLKVDTV